VTDIVERLNGPYPDKEHLAAVLEVQYMKKEAADEIERLRAEIADITERLGTSIMSATEQQTKLSSARELAESEGARSVESLRRARKAEAERDALRKACEIPYCGCTLSERESGHVADCWMPAFLQAVDAARGR